MESNSPSTQTLVDAICTASSLPYPFFEASHVPKVVEQPSTANKKDMLLPLKSFRPKSRDSYAGRNRSQRSISEPVKPRVASVTSYSLVASDTESARRASESIRQTYNDGFWSVLLVSSHQCPVRACYVKGGVCRGVSA